MDVSRRRELRRKRKGGRANISEPGRHLPSRNERVGGLVKDSYRFQERRADISCLPRRRRRLARSSDPFTKKNSTHGSVAPRSAERSRRRPPLSEHARCLEARTCRNGGCRVRSDARAGQRITTAAVLCSTSTPSSPMAGRSMVSRGRSSVRRTWWLLSPRTLPVAGSIQRAS